MAEQQNCYPSQALIASSPEDYPICITCNSNSGGSNCPPSDCRNTLTCSSLCNAHCNTVCDTIQSYAQNGHKYLYLHGDIQGHPETGCTGQKEIIDRAWTAKYWNSLIDKLKMGEIVGKTKNQGGDPLIFTYAVADPKNQVPHPDGSLIKAAHYNELGAAYKKFLSSLDEVKVGDIIRSSHAEALKNNYLHLKFNQDVCDTCNAGAQSFPGRCGCNCSCSCSCGCDCDSPDDGD